MNDQNNDVKAVSSWPEDIGQIEESGKTGVTNGLAVSADKKMQNKEKADKDNLYIRIDVRYFRISFHKATLERMEIRNTSVSDTIQKPSGLLF